MYLTRVTATDRTRTLTRHQFVCLRSAGTTASGAACRHRMAVIGLGILALALSVPGVASPPRSPTTWEVLHAPLPAEILTLAETPQEITITGPTFEYRVDRTNGAISTLCAVRQDSVVAELCGPAEIAIDDWSLRAGTQAARVATVRHDAGQVVISVQNHWVEPQDAERVIDGSLEHTFYSDGVLVTHAYRWVKVTDQALFPPRDGAGAVVFADKMWLLGGWNPMDKATFPQTCISDVWSSVDGATWTRLPDAPWEGRHTAGYVVHDGKIWIVGGDAIQRHYQNDVWNSSDGVHWNCVTNEVPWKARVLHYTVAHDGRIWVMGGQSLPQFAPGTRYSTTTCGAVVMGCIGSKSRHTRPGRHAA